MGRAELVVLQGGLKLQKMSDIIFLSIFWDNFKISDSMGYIK